MYKKRLSVFDKQINIKIVIRWYNLIISNLKYKN
jgi:hypothetical protein